MLSLDVFDFQFQKTAFSFLSTSKQDRSPSGVEFSGMI